MPRQHEPRAGETTSSLAVRRAVAVPVPGEDPGADLRPRTPESAPAPDSAADPDASVSTVSSSEPAPGRRTRWGFRSTTGEPAAAEQEEERQEKERQPEEQRRQAAEPGGAGAGVVAGAAAGAVAAGTGDGGTADEDAEGTGPGRLRGPMVAAAAIVGAVLICVPLLVLGLNREDERTVETAPAGGTTLDPGTSDGIPAVDYQAGSPSPSASPSGSESASGSPAESDSEPEPEPEPKTKAKAKPAPPRPAEVKEAEAPKRSAATAVQRLAAEEPGGRHICYRVHVAGRGWSDTVCDGGTAGTAGSGAPITAVNIAVSGTRGTSGGAFVHDPASTNGEGHFPEPWSNAVDGIDNYVGSTEKDAPHMLGFTINVDGGAGAVCQSSYVHDDAWLGLACDEPGTGYDFTYAGTHDNESWIEAVRLTV
ncbi:hypothetical protein ACIRPQ_04660 [Streptomyces sp. NPDC101213]|uniref:hypothetical protein n=1 Tax=Streptomyces sp. NPDC101213 TaxID=3366130 RepID=UPI003823827D